MSVRRLNKTSGFFLLLKKLIHVCIYNIYRFYAIKPTHTFFYFLFSLFSKFRISSNLIQPAYIYTPVVHLAEFETSLNKSNIYCVAILLYRNITMPS